MGPKLACPKCHQFESEVTHSRPDETGHAFRRRRRCLHCGRRFQTEERIVHSLPSPKSSTSDQM